MSCFFGHNIAREGAGEGKWGDYGMNPKPKKKLSLGAGSYVTITWKSFFTQSQVLLSSGIVVTPSYTHYNAFVCASEIRVRINGINFPNHLFMYSLHHFYVCKSG